MTRGRPCRGRGTFSGMADMADRVCPACVGRRRRVPDGARAGPLVEADLGAVDELVRALCREHDMFGAVLSDSTACWALANVLMALDDLDEQLVPLVARRIADAIAEARHGA